MKESDKEKIKLENSDTSDIEKELNKKFGEGTVVRKSLKIDVIPTGSFSLDRALGIGGLPVGRIVEIFGPESGGKTTLALSIVAQIQKSNGNVGYIDAEQALDPNYAKSLGVKFSDMILTQPSIAEDALNIMLMMIQSRKFRVVILDSTASMTTRSELEGDIGDHSMAVKARLMSQALRLINHAAAETGTIAIFINQVRENIGVTWGSKETTPGGRAVRFAASVRIDVRRMSTLKENDIPVGILVKAKVVKNKVAPPYKEAEYYLIFGKGISVPMDVFNTALSEDVIKKDGNTYYFGEEKIGVGIKKCTEELENNKKLMDDIIEKIRVKDAESSK